MEKFKFLPKEKIDNLPKTSGVYCFVELNPKPYALCPIYIGKAVNIRNRVKNHFNQPNYRDNLFIDKIDKIGYSKTDSEIEALVLEANLIKKYQPKFNVMWRDDKNYFYIAISQKKDKIPYIYITHQPKKLQTTNYKLQTKYIGPFVDGTALKKTLRFLRRAFPYYTAKKHPKVRCTYCHLDLCPGPTPDLPEYKKNIKKLILILQGKKISALRSLKREMGVSSANKKFEKAAKLRDQVRSLQQVMSHAHIINMNEDIIRNSATAEFMMTFHKIEAYDVSNIQGKFATGSMVVFVNNQPDKSQYKKFKIRTKNEPNDIAMLKEVLTRRFARQNWPYPDAILIDGGKAQLNIAIKTRNEICWPKNNTGSVFALRQKRYQYRNIKILALAKGKQELFVEGKKNAIPLKNLPQGTYNLIKRLDDEAHRFAVAYHKKLRKSNLLS